MYRPCIVGVSGQAGAGKDTVADYLIDSFGFVRISLADPMKRFGRVVFGFSEKQLWGSSHWRNGVDHRFATPAAWEVARCNLEEHGRAWCTDVLQEASPSDVEAAFEDLVHWFLWLQQTQAVLSPRVFLQSLGTEYGRACLGADVWVNYMMRAAKTVLHSGSSTHSWDYDATQGVVEVPGVCLIRGVVVPDVRFANELSTIKRAGGSLIRVVRKETDAEASTLGLAGHSSESQAFRSTDFDFIVNNDHTQAELLSHVDLYMTTFFTNHR